MRKIKVGQLLIAFSNNFQRHIRKLLIHKMTLNKTPPEEHPSIVSEQLKDYEMDLSSLLTARLSKPCLPLTIAIVHLLDSIRSIFEKVSRLEESQTFQKELVPIENVKITKNVSRAQSQSFPISIPKMSDHGNTKLSPPSIVVKGFSEKVSNPLLECESENTLNNYQQSMKEKLQKITAEVKNTKESMFLSTSAVIKRLFSQESKLNPIAELVLRLLIL